MRRRILSAAALFAFVATLTLVGCDDAKSSNTGVPDKPSQNEKTTKDGKGKIIADEPPPPPHRG